MYPPRAAGCGGLPTGRPCLGAMGQGGVHVAQSLPGSPLAAYLDGQSLY